MSNGLDIFKVLGVKRDRLIPSNIYPIFKADEVTGVIKLGVELMENFVRDIGRVLRYWLPKDAETGLWHKVLHISVSAVRAAIPVVVEVSRYITKVKSVSPATIRLEFANVAEIVTSDVGDVLSHFIDRIQEDGDYTRLLERSCWK
jgi:hypothetical protein